VDSNALFSQIYQLLVANLAHYIVKGMATAFEAASTILNLSIKQGSAPTHLQRSVNSVTNIGAGQVNILKHLCSLINFLLDNSSCDVQ